MKVYVVTEDEYEDTTIMGVYASVEKAKAVHPAKWEPIGTSDPEGWYEKSRRSALLSIHSHEVIQ